MADPWAFGWTQVLTITGFLITISIAIGGFRTFNRWKRERIEEKKIETAFEALAFAYETASVINSIRAPMRNPAEWADMPSFVNESESDRERRAPAHVIWKRLNFHSDFFSTTAEIAAKGDGNIWSRYGAHILCDSHISYGNTNGVLDKGDRRFRQRRRRKSRNTGGSSREATKRHF